MPWEMTQDEELCSFFFQRLEGGYHLIPNDIQLHARIPKIDFRVRFQKDLESRNKEKACKDLLERSDRNGMSEPCTQGRKEKTGWDYS